MVVVAAVVGCCCWLVLLFCFRITLSSKLKLKIEPALFIRSRLVWLAYRSVRLACGVCRSSSPSRWMTLHRLVSNRMDKIARTNDEKKGPTPSPIGARGEGGADGESHQLLRWLHQGQMSVCLFIYLLRIYLFCCVCSCCRPSSLLVIFYVYCSSCWLSPRHEQRSGCFPCKLNTCLRTPVSTYGTNKGICFKRCFSWLCTEQVNCMASSTWYRFGLV